MNSVTYPNGQQLSSTELSVNQIQIVFQALTCAMLGIITSPATANLTLVTGQLVAVADSLVGIYAGETVSAAGLPEGTQVTAVDPITSKVYFSQAATASGSQTATFTDPACYSKVRVDWQKEGQPMPGIDQDACFLRAVEKNDEYNQIRQSKLIPNSDPNTVTMQTTWTRCWEITWELWGPNSFERGNLIRDALYIDFPNDTLAQSNLYWVPYVDRIDRAPQNLNGQWWPVAYLSCDFYEAVTQTLTTPVGKSVEVVLSDSTGVLADRTIEL